MKRNDRQYGRGDDSSEIPHTGNLSQTPLETRVPRIQQFYRTTEDVVGTGIVLVIVASNGPSFSLIRRASCQFGVVYKRSKLLFALWPRFPLQDQEQILVGLPDRDSPKRELLDSIFSNNRSVSSQDVSRELANGWEHEWKPSAQPPCTSTTFVFSFIVDPSCGEVFQKFRRIAPECSARRSLSVFEYKHFPAVQGAGRSDLPSKVGEWGRDCADFSANADQSAKDLAVKIAKLFFCRNSAFAWNSAPPRLRTR